MSFPRAKLTRFNEKAEGTASPNKNPPTEVGGGGPSVRQVVSPALKTPRGVSKCGMSRTSPACRSFVRTVKNTSTSRASIRSRSYDESDFTKTAEKTGEIFLNNNSTDKLIDIQSIRDDDACSDTSSIKTRSSVTGTKSIKKGDFAFPPLPEENTSTNKENVNKNTSAVKNGDDVPVIALSTAKTSGIPVKRMTQKANSFTGKIKSCNISAGNISLGKKPSTPITDRANNKRTLEIQYYTKKKRLAVLKKELIEKQRPVIDIYNAMLDLKKKIVAQSGRDFPIDDLKVVDCSEYVSKYDEKFRKADGGGEKLSVASLIPVAIDANTIKMIEEKLNEIPSLCSNLHCDILEKIQILLDSIKNEPAVYEDVSRELKTYEQSLNKLTETQNAKVAELIEYIKQDASSKANSISKINEENLKAFQEKLETEKKSMKIEIDKKVAHYERIVHELKTKLEIKTAETVELERVKVAKDEAEAKLKSARCKLREVDIKTKMDEATIEQFQNTIKKLETQIKNKDTINENRNKELEKSSKLNDALVIKAEKKRDALEIRIKDLKELLSSKEIEFDNKVLELKNKLETSEKMSNDSKTEKEKFEKKYGSVRDKLIKLEIKYQQMLELTQKKKIISGTLVGSTTHTQTEIDIWTELQATRVALKAAEEKLNKKNEEKARFMKTIDKVVAEKDNMSSESWTAQLIKKDEYISKLQRKIDRLSDVIIMSKEIAEKQENEISELKKRIDNLATKGDGNKGELSELKAMVNESRNKADSALKRNADLEQKLMQKEHALTLAENKNRDLENLLKVRQNVIGLIKSKKEMSKSECQQMKEYVSEITHQYNELSGQFAAKTEEVNDLYNTLECKSMLVQRLERTIQSMEKLCQDSNEHTVELTDEVKKLHKALDDSQKQLEQYTYASPPTTSRGAFVRYC